MSTYSAAHPHSYTICSKACVNETRKTSAKPNFWKWLDNATYEGEVQIRHISYGFWGYNVSIIPMCLEAQMNSEFTCRWEDYDWKLLLDKIRTSQCTSTVKLLKNLPIITLQKLMVVNHLQTAAI